jgi:uncharacterized protein YukE
MGQPVSANYAALDDLQQKATQTGTGIDEVCQRWAARVAALEAVWPDNNGLLFAKVNAALATFETETTDFLQALAAAVAQARASYQNAGAYTYARVSALPGA